MVRIVADSTCDIGLENVARLGVTIVPLYVVMEERSLKDGLEVTPHELFLWADAHKETPKTAAANQDDFAKCFSSLLQGTDEIVFFGISEDMSATCGNARVAAGAYPPGKVRVVDTRNITCGSGHLIYQAAEMARAGACAEEIVRASEKMIPKVRTSFVVDTLLYLYRGGRCSAVAAMSAMALRIKPEIAVENGVMHPRQKFRGRIEHVVDRYVAALAPALENAMSKRVFIVHTMDDDTTVSRVRNQIAAMNRFDEIVVERAGCVISSHCGPGTLGVIYVED